MSTWAKNNLQAAGHPDDHGMIFNGLIYTSIFWTVFLVTLAKPHRYYKNIISFLFNLKFKWRGSDWKIYHVLILITLFFVFLLSFLTMQHGMYVPDKTETYERRMYKLSNKWLIESEMWLTFLIIVEILSIYRIATLNDKKWKIAQEGGLTTQEVIEIETNSDKCK